MRERLVKSSHGCQVAWVFALLIRTQSDLADPEGRPELKWIKFNNGKACACPLKEALNWEVLERWKELANNMSFIHSFTLHLTIIYIASPLRNRLTYRLSKHGKTRMKHDACFPGALNAVIQDLLHLTLTKPCNSFPSTIQWLSNFVSHLKHILGIKQQLLWKGKKISSLGWKLID